jgi:chromosome partitioning protein
MCEYGDMRTLAVASRKGGAGKTTLALHLAVASEAAGRAAVVLDLDPQASATVWRDMRRAETPPVTAIPAARLKHALTTAREHGAELAIIDTPPQAESVILDAARASDLILVPCRPAILDMRAIGATIDIARLAGKPAVIVVNGAPTRGGLVTDAMTALKRTHGVPVAPVAVGHRAAFFHALTDGQVAQEFEPKGKAADEIRQLYTWAVETGAKVG